MAPQRRRGWESRQKRGVGAVGGIALVPTSNTACKPSRGTRHGFNECAEHPGGAMVRATVVGVTCGWRGSPWDSGAESGGTEEWASGCQRRPSNRPGASIGHHP
jgi:hypothetical protein